MLLKNTSLYFVGEMINRGGKLLSLYLLAGIIAKADFGRYSYILSLGLIALVFFDFGMNSLVMLRTSWKRFEHLLPVFFLAKLIVVTTTSLLLAAYDLVFGLLGTPGMLAPFLLLCIGWDATAFLGNALRTRLDFKAEFLIKIMSNSGFLLLLSAAIFAGVRVNIVGALWLQAITFLPACVMGLIWLLRGLRQALPHGRHARRALLSIAKIGAPLTLAASAGVAQTSIDSIVLGAGAHMEVNASYTLVNRLGQLAQLPVNILIFTGLPYVIESLRGGNAPDKKLLHTIVSLLIGFGVTVAQIFVIANEWILPLALGPHYTDVRYFAPWLGFYIIPLYIYPLYMNLLSAMRHVVVAQAISAVATLMNLMLDLLVIRLYGPYAVAWIAGSMHWVLLAAYAAYYRMKIGYWPMSKDVAGYALFGGMTILMPVFFLAPATVTESLLRATLALITAVVTGLLLLKHRTVIRDLIKH